MLAPVRFSALLVQRACGRSSLRKSVSSFASTPRTEPYHARGVSGWAPSQLLCSNKVLQMRTTGLTGARQGRVLVALAGFSVATSMCAVAYAQEDMSEWKVLRIAGDGRCLFRSVAQAAASRSGGQLLDAKAETTTADSLRRKALAELANRREETEWFIEEDFDIYIARMSQPNTWGGEPEILMLTHVLMSPINVYMSDNRLGLRCIAEYGQEYAEACDDPIAPIRIIFHGAGHYEAIVVNPRQSRL